jgi:hypothetical protein
MEKLVSEEIVKTSSVHFAGLAHFHIELHSKLESLHRHIDKQDQLPSCNIDQRIAFPLWCFTVLLIDQKAQLQDL